MESHMSWSNITASNKSKFLSYFLCHLIFLYFFIVVYCEWIPLIDICDIIFTRLLYDLTNYIT